MTIHMVDVACNATYGTLHIVILKVLTACVTNQC